MEVFSHVIKIHAKDIRKKGPDQIELFKTIIQLIRAFELGFIMFEKNYVKSQVFSAVKILAKKHGVEASENDIVFKHEEIW